MLKQQTPGRSRLLSRARGTVAAAAATVVIAPAIVISSAIADEAPVTADSAAHGHGVFVDGLGLDVLGAARAHAVGESAPGPVADSLNLSLLGGLPDVDLGTVSIPLIAPTPTAPGLLHLGELGTLSSRAQAASPTSATASSGIIAADGSLNVDAAHADGFEPAHLNVTSLLEQVIGAVAVADLIDEARIEIGALGARAAKNGTTLTQEYALADLRVDFSSPLVADLTTEVDALVGTALQPVVDLIGPGGDVEQLVAGVVSTIDALPLVSADLDALSIDTQALVDSVRAELLAAPLENAEQSLSINLADGSITVDLAQILIDSQGVTSLNDLGANTDALSGVVVNAILDGVSDALIGSGPNSLVSKTVALVTDGVYDLALDVSIEVTALAGAVDAPVSVSGTVGGFVNQPGAPDPVVDVSGLSLLGIPLGDILQPTTDALTDLVTDLATPLPPAVADVVADVQPIAMAAIQPLVTELLDDALEPILQQVVQIRINEQPTVAPLSQSADLGAGSFTVRALAVRLLPGIADVGLELGSASVKALDAEDTDADGTDADGTDADGTDADGTDADGTDADGTDADGTDADGTDADGTDADGTDADGTDADGTDADGTDADGTDADDDWFDDEGDDPRDDELASAGGVASATTVLAAVLLLGLGLTAMAIARRRATS